MEIRIGTSGFSFADWKGVFYPSGMTNAKFFDHYASVFKTVEINSTYYGIPRPAVFAKMAEKAPDGFDFIIKTHKSFTHERHTANENRETFLSSVAPVADSGRLSGLLAQFPYAFQFTESNLKYLLSGKDYFPGHTLFVEFRHDSWYNRDVFYRVRDAGLHWVSVDLPALSHLPESHALTGIDTMYIRLHGRNAEKWYGGGDQRYDYLYSDRELAEWKEKIEKLRAKTKRAYIFFNNCYRGQAVRNAQELIKLFEL